MCCDVRVQQAHLGLRSRLKGVQEFGEKRCGKSLLISQLPYGGSESLLGCDGQARGQLHHRLGREQDEEQTRCVEEKPQRATPAPGRPSAVRRRS